MNSLGLKSKFLAIVAIPLVIASYQSCSRNSANFNSPTQTTQPQSRANGEGYAGKLVTYEHYSDKTKCPATSSQENPPNDVIFARINEKAYLVREDCRDIPPIEVSDNFAAEEMNFISYNGKNFDNNSAAGLAQLPLLCPSGTSPTSVTPENIVSSSLDFQNPSWFIQDGVSVSLFGSTLGLPTFTIERNDTAPGWSQILEVINLNANQRYAASFYAESGNISTTRVLFSQWSTVVLEIDIDLTNGSHTIINQPNSTNLEVLAQPFANGYYVTVFFEPTIDGGINIGLGPAPHSGVADIKASAIRLVPNLSSYCQ